MIQRILFLMGLMPLAFFHMACGNPPAGPVTNNTNNYGLTPVPTWNPAIGANWYEATSAADWSARNGHKAVVYNNKIWITGGYTSDYTNEVWSSADGVHWTQTAGGSMGVTFPVRYEHSSVVFNNKMYVIGGRGPSSSTTPGHLPMASLGLPRPAGEPPSRRGTDIPALFSTTGFG